MNNDLKKDSIGASGLYDSFHQRLMGDVEDVGMGDIRRQFGEAHLRGKITDAEFTDLEHTAKAVYELLHLENPRLPAFTVRTLQSQQDFEDWLDRLSETDDWPSFKRGYRELEKAYKSHAISAFDTLQLQTMCQTIYNQFFKRDYPGSFGLIIAPNSLVAGVKKPSRGAPKRSTRTHVGAMSGETAQMVDTWRRGEDLNWFPEGVSYKSMVELPEADFIKLSDQAQPPKVLASRSRKPKIGGRDDGDIDVITHRLLELWRTGTPVGKYTVDQELGVPSHEAPEFIKNAARHPAVPSAFLLWILDNLGYYENLREVATNPSLSKDDALQTMREYTFKNQWRDNFGKRWCTITAAEALLDNPAFSLYLMDDPSFYEEFFNHFSSIGNVANNAVYTEHIDRIMAHPQMQPWLGKAKVFTFKKVKRSQDEEFKSRFPMSLTLYENGVVRVIQPKSMERGGGQLFRDLAAFISYQGGLSGSETPKSLLAKSDQMSKLIKKKGISK